MRILFIGWKCRHLRGSPLREGLMRLSTTTLFFLGFVIASSTAVALAQAVQSESITKGQSDTLLAVLQGKNGYKKRLKKLPTLPMGALQPVQASSGPPCLLPGEHESRIWLQYVVGGGASGRRTVFEFTVTPTVASVYKGVSLAGLLERRTVTQYLVWHASSSPGTERTQDPGVVVDFNTRSAALYCIVP